MTQHFYILNFGERSLDVRINYELIKNMHDKNSIQRVILAKGKRETKEQKRNSYFLLFVFAKNQKNHVKIAREKKQKAEKLYFNNISSVFSKNLVFHACKNACIQKHNRHSTQKHVFHEKRINRCPPTELPQSWMQCGACRNFTVQIAKNGQFLRAKPQNPTRRAQKIKKIGHAHSKKTTQVRELPYFSCVFLHLIVAFCPYSPSFLSIFPLLPRLYCIFKQNMRLSFHVRCLQTQCFALYSFLSVNR